MAGSLAGAIEFIRLEETLRDFAGGRKFIYISNPGNWGDGLIRYATKRFFHRNAFDYVSLSFRKAMKADPEQLKRITGSKEIHMVYGGGGLFIDKYARTAQIPGLVARSDRMLVLPHTFGMSAEKLGFRDIDILFRRDHAGSKEFAPDALFCHDMALSMDPIRSSSEGSGVGFFFREDAEKIKGMELPAGNRDISQEGTESSQITPFLEAIAQFGTIHTNRLHVAISGALMGRRVHLYANSYFKNESIYKASLQGAFPNVSFHRSFAGLDGVGAK